VSRPIRVVHVTTVDATLRFMLLAQLRRLREEGYEVAAISARGPWVGSLEEHGIRHIPWTDATRAWDPAADLRAFRALVAILRRERFDLVHTHNPKPGVLGRIAARRAGVPCVVNTVHGLFATPEDPPRRRVPVLAAERLAAHFSDLELYQSEEDLTWARAIGLVDPPRSMLLGNGIDLSWFDPTAVPGGRVAELRRELGAAEGDVVVGTVGRLVAEKGYGELALAAARVREAHPGTRFVAAGPGDPAKSDALDPRRLREHVTFTGWREDVRDLLAAMDVFVLPSWREGLPRSAIEAAAMGKALVLTDIRGCREVARDGREGLLVPRRDPRRLAEALLRLVGDPALRDRLGQAARERAVARFDERKVGDRLVEAYREVLAERGVATVSTVPRRTGPGPAEAHHRIPDLGTVTIRPARPEEAGYLAELHATTHPEAFLPQLGRPFLEVLYRAQIEEPVGLALVAEWEERPIGYTTGLVSTPEFRRRFARRYGARAAVAVLPRLLRPGVLRRFLDLARYPEKVRGLPDAEWTFIALDPGVQARGLGTLLGRSMVEALADRGAGEVKTFVASDNEPSNRMVKRLGFQPRGDISIHDGVPSNLYVIRCRSS
jgi:glycosyltransferase involved in cell wall biosynthesis/ribosomal protein S18 acetylase RimI-like enzyme